MKDILFIRTILFQMEVKILICLTILCLFGSVYTAPMPNVVFASVGAPVSAPKIPKTPKAPRNPNSRNPAPAILAGGLIAKTAALFGVALTRVG